MYMRLSFITACRHAINGLSHPAVPPRVSVQVAGSIKEQRIISKQSIYNFRALIRERGSVLPFFYA